jgi:hypothetical protein
MKTGGWIVMITAWTFILSMGIFCFSRIFKKKDKPGKDGK